MLLIKKRKERKERKKRRDEEIRKKKNSCGVHSNVGEKGKEFCIRKY